MGQLHFQVVVIGGGPGGYVAAIRCAQLGLGVACIDAGESLGGTCLNVGCIPSKALLQASEAYASAQHQFKEFGINFTGLSLDLDQMQKNKTKVVSSLTRGIPLLFRKNKVTHIRGFASFDTAERLVVTAGDQTTQTVTFDHCIIASGSRPIELKSAPFDEERIVSSTGALAFKQVPSSLVVIGGGVIGVELASVWARLGSKVHILEALPRILPSVDEDIANELVACLRKQGIALATNALFKSAEPANDGLNIIYHHDGSDHEIRAEKLLVAVGRRPAIEGQGFERIGLKFDADRPTIAVNERFQTNLGHIYAIGDVIRGPMLAHKAEEEGVVCANLIAGKHGHINYDAIPNIVYTWPEIAAVGKTSAQCEAAGIATKIGKFPFIANGRAKSMGESRGFVKLIADAHSDLLLGAQIVGPGASELIAELTLAIEFSASAEDIALTVHGHPTLSETVKEAALAVSGSAIHV